MAAQVVAAQLETTWTPGFPLNAPPEATLALHTWTGASSDQKGLSSSGKLLHCTLEFNEPLRGSPSGLPTFSFLSERCCVRAHLFNKTKQHVFEVGFEPTPRREWTPGIAAASSHLSYRGEPLGFAGFRARAQGAQPLALS